MRITKAWGLRTLPGEGVADDPGWGAEVSLMILGITPAGALGLARQFGQRAVVVGRRGRPRGCSGLEW